MRLELYGGTDADNPEAVTAEELKAWCAKRDARWLGHVEDVREVWRHADIFVLPARSREGMPRALLEAAASARPLVVTDVPGCRHFVRDGVEGFVVPPENADALANCLGAAGARSRPATAHGRGGAPAAAARLHGGARQAIAEVDLRLDARQRAGLMRRAGGPGFADGRAGPPRRGRCDERRHRVPDGDESQHDQHHVGARRRARPRRRAWHRPAPRADRSAGGAPARASRRDTRAQAA